MESSPFVFCWDPHLSGRSNNFQLYNFPPSDVDPLNWSLGGHVGVGNLFIMKNSGRGGGGRKQIRSKKAMKTKRFPTGDRSPVGQLCLGFFF